MKARAIKMKKWGQITQEIRKIFKQYKVVAAYAYNSPFDEKVFNFNCNWFKTQNPFENLPIYDIRGYAHSKICTTEKYMDFCDMNNRLTESGNYSTTAESVYQYLSGNIEFEEEHTALADSVIDVETYEILKQLYDSLDDISCNLTGEIDSLEDLIAAIDNFLKDKKNIKIFD